jgi:hypothetical protein
MIRSGRFGARHRVRIDLHGFSTFGPGTHHQLIRWESVIEIVPSVHGVVIRSPSDEIVFPARVFGLEPSTLAERLEVGRSIFERGEVIEALARASSG